MGAGLAVGLTLTLMSAVIFYGDLFVIFNSLTHLKAQGERVCFLSRGGEEEVSREDE